MDFLSEAGRECFVGLVAFGFVLNHEGNGAMLQQHCVH